MANHVLSTLTQQGNRGLPAALQTNDPSRFEGGEEALLRCVQELVTCIRISERDTLARLICRCGLVWCGVLWFGHQNASPPNSVQYHHGIMKHASMFRPKKIGVRK